MGVSAAADLLLHEFGRGPGGCGAAAGAGGDGGAGEGGGIVGGLSLAYSRVVGRRRVPLGGPRPVGFRSLRLEWAVRPRRARTIDLVQATAQAPSVVDWQRALRVAVERSWTGSARAQTLRRREWW